MRPWVLVDVPNLAYRAFYSTGGLTHEGRSTGVVYGFLRELCKLADTFGPKMPNFQYGFFFDGGRLLRSDLFPGYKMRKDTPERAEVKRQIKLLRELVLPELGFKALYRQSGYEADDLIAEAVSKLAGAGRKVLIVSGDQDLYQLLRFPDVTVYDPLSKKRHTFDSFRKTKGITPAFWPKVKSLVGCTSDTVPGCNGVGEATAIKFFNGDLKPTARERAARAFTESDEYQRNLKLTALPYEGTKTLLFHSHEFTREKWAGVCKEYGLRSLLHQSPVPEKARKG
jgi:5'-3' exonuclease